MPYDPSNNRLTNVEIALKAILAMLRLITTLKKQNNNTFLSVAISVVVGIDPTQKINATKTDYLITLPSST